jgi:hypothetical protein
MMFLLAVAALGLGFDWHNQSAEESRNFARRDGRNIT